MVIDYLKSAGIKEKDIKTTNYSLYPVYEENVLMTILVLENVIVN